MQEKRRFRLLGPISGQQVIARGAGVENRTMMNRLYGKGQWRKMKGIATIELANGEIRRAELHWFEAHGIGKRRIKVKKYLD